MSWWLSDGVKNSNWRFGGVELRSRRELAKELGVRTPGNRIEHDLG